ncbi:MAG: prenyltransferase/squalene oxidase repeat-containing protein, partial [Planctomycetota bacterium]
PPGSIYAGRFESYAEKFAGQDDGLEDPAVRTATRRALLWLANAQGVDGSWEDASSEVSDASRGRTPSGRVGVTALCLTAFLDDGNTPVSGPFKLVVERAVHWLESQQDAQSGLIGERRGHTYLYDHGIATQVLARVHGIAPDLGLESAAQAAVDLVLRARNPYGAWRYDLPPSGDNDTSITGWMVLALTAAARAGLRTDSAALIGALDWFDAVTEEASGRVGYDSAGSRSSRIVSVNDHFPPERGEGMTAVALLCRQVIGQTEATKPILRKHAALLLRRLPEWDPDGLGTDMYYWHFGTRAMRALGGERWATWKTSLHYALLSSQEHDGSWPAAGPWGMAGGRAYSTALMAVCLLQDTSAADELGGAVVPEQEQEHEHSADSRTPVQGIADGLEWLRKHQHAGGRWDCDEFMQQDPPEDRCSGPGDPMHDVGVTGLALLAFLGDGNSLDQGPANDVVRRGIRWLRRQQDPDSGLIGEQLGHTFLYDHAVASLALVQTYAASGDPVLKQPAQRAVNYILRARNPYGAWRYEVPPIGDNDTSVTGWMVRVLVAARHVGLRIDPDALVGSLNWIDAVTDRASGRVGYNSVGSVSSRIAGVNDHYPTGRTETMTAVGLACRLLLGQDPMQEPILWKHAELLLASLPQWDPDGFGNDMYYWFFGSWAMYLMGGRHWKAWNTALNAAALQAQRADGAHRGSWDPVGPWGVVGGRVYSTSMVVLALESGDR